MIQFRPLNRIMEVVTAVLAVVLAVLLFFQSTPAQRYRNQLSLGNRFLTAGNYEKAEAAFNAAIKIDSKKADPYLGLGSVYAVQADTILNQYQDGTSSVKDRSSEFISTEEKERMEELYRKAQEAWKKASELDSGNKDTEQALSYVEQQQEKAEDLRTDDSENEAKITPVPTASPTPKTLEDLIDTNGGKLTVLEAGSTVNTIDFDGDGQADSAYLAVSESQEYEISAFEVQINGQQALTFSDLQQNGWEVVDIQADIMQTNEDEIYLTAEMGIVDVGTMADALYRYHNGSFEKVIDLAPKDDTNPYALGVATDFSVAGNTIHFRMGCETSSMAGIYMWRILVCHDGKAEFLSPIADITTNDDTDKLAADSDHYDTLKCSLDLYATGDPAKDNNVSATLEAGTRCKITKAYFTDGTHLQRLYLTAEGGQNGWFDQGACIEREGAAPDTIFEERLFTGGGI